MTDEINQLILDLDNEINNGPVTKENVGIQLEGKSFSVWLNNRLKSGGTPEAVSKDVQVGIFSFYNNNLPSTIAREESNRLGEMVRERLQQIHGKQLPEVPISQLQEEAKLDLVENELKQKEYDFAQEIKPKPKPQSSDDSMYYVWGGVAVAVAGLILLVALK